MPARGLIGLARVSADFVYILDFTHVDCTSVLFVVKCCTLVPIMKLSIASPNYICCALIPVEYSSEPQDGVL